MHYLISAIHIHPSWANCGRPQLCLCITHKRSPLPSWNPISGTHAKVSDGIISTTCRPSLFWRNVPYFGEMFPILEFSEKCSGQTYRPSFVFFRQILSPNLGVMRHLFRECLMDFISLLIGYIDMNRIYSIAHQVLRLSNCSHSTDRPTLCPSLACTGCFSHSP